jgi:DNA-binding MarR family transcriptional regulator
MSRQMPRTPDRPTPEDYRSAAALRAAVRQFLRRGEQAARAAGLTPQRQLLLLMIKGAPDGSEQATVGELAERMQLAPNTVTELIDRAEDAGLVLREGDASDGRVVRLRVTWEGEQRLAETVLALSADRHDLARRLADLDLPETE